MEKQMKNGGWELLWTMESPSQEFENLPRLSSRGELLHILYDYELEHGGQGEASIKFGGVQAFSFTIYDACTPEQIDAYDKVLVTKNSPQLNEFLARKNPGHTPLAHYRIFFDEVGCYDIFGTSFTRSACK